MTFPEKLAGDGTTDFTDFPDWVPDAHLTLAPLHDVENLFVMFCDLNLGMYLVHFYFAATSWMSAPEEGGGLAAAAGLGGLQLVQDLHQLAVEG